MTVFLGLVTPLIAYAVVTLLHVVIPARRRPGYVKSEATGEVLTYRTNGRYVLIVSILLWFVLGYLGIVPYGWLYQTRWYGVIGACVIGLVFLARSLCSVGRKGYTGPTRQRRVLGAVQVEPYDEIVPLYAELPNPCRLSGPAGLRGCAPRSTSREGRVPRPQPEGAMRPNSCRSVRGPR